MAQQSIRNILQISSKYIRLKKSLEAGTFFCVCVLLIEQLNTVDNDALAAPLLTI